jgi:hypothetical protein
MWIILPFLCFHLFWRFVFQVVICLSYIFPFTFALDALYAISCSSFFDLIFSGMLHSIVPGINVVHDLYFFLILLFVNVLYFV